MTSTSVNITSLHDLLNSGRIYKYKKGQISQSTNTELMLMLVKKGYIMRYQILNDGVYSIQSIYGPGDIFSLTLVFKEIYDYDLYNGPETFFYEAMCDTEVSTISIEDIKQKLKENPLLYSDLLMIAGGRLRIYVHQLENLSLKNSLKRVAHELLFISSRFGVIDNNSKVQIMMPLTHKILADVLSLTRETVTLSLNQLSKSGLVKKSGKYFVIQDVEKLKDFAYE